MAKLSDDELKRIVEERLPGRTVVRSAPARPDAGTWAPPDATTPDIAALRRKYLGDAAASAARRDAGTYVPDAGAEGREAVIVPVESTHPRDAHERGPGTKGVVVSDDGKVIGVQG